MILAPSQNPGRPPMGGKWQYNANGIILSDESFLGLVEKAQTHLIANLYTTDEIRQMILAQERQRCPWLVVEVEGQIKIPQHQRPFRDYIKHLGNAEYLDEDDFQKRAAICLKCPHNAPIEIDDEAKRLLYLITRGKKTEHLGYCQFYRHANAIACMVEKKPTIPVDTKLSSPCWANPIHA